MDDNDIYDVLSYGPIVYPTFNDVREVRLDQPLSSHLLITINGAYLNLWVGGSYGWQNTDCRYVGDNIGSWTLDEIIENAKSYYEDAMALCKEEDDDGYN